MRHHLCATLLLVVLAIACERQPSAPDGPLGDLSAADIVETPDDDGGGAGEPGQGTGIAPSSSSSCIDQGTVSVRPEVVLGYQVYKPSSCIQTFDGRTIRLHAEVRPRQIVCDEEGIVTGAPVPGWTYLNGACGWPHQTLETREWYYYFFAHDANGIDYNNSYTGELPFFNVSCYVDPCPVVDRQWQTQGIHTKYSFSLYTSDDRDAMHITILPPILTSSITGPSSMQAMHIGTWYANASGGSTPYTHTWYFRPSGASQYMWKGTGSSLTMTYGVCNSSFSIKLKTTSPNGQTKTTFKTVTVGSAQPGYDCIDSN